MSMVDYHQITSTASTGRQYDLVFVSFWTEPALVFTLYYHLDLLKSNGHFALHDNRHDIIDYIPGVKAIESKDLPSYLQETDVSTIMHRLIDEAFKDVEKADFILCNTIEELELEAILALQEKQPFYAIGPLPSGFTKGIVPTSLRPESNCTQWLKPKPCGSVLCVSFGSFLTSRKRDIDEIAHGLALSKVNFIWVLRHDAVSYEESYVLPIGFEEEVEDRGLVVKWTNQFEIEVISHPSIGGFLTHCGWNSISQSIWCGVPILCFPLTTNQITKKIAS
ncbi:UDP-glycosyltransferase 86A1-like [Morus notabilis]|uniref:UDP-glycosyltransferase 86A1-like n=1 Tax=Morus notabilis TaxID=981085 RepID=UPI000CED1D56|nr:UDP-glycosyltransferase 86A1-like [Morus notabilis]